MATPDRQELIRNAVSFLNDPKARIHFPYAILKLTFLSVGSGITARTETPVPRSKGTDPCRSGHCVQAGCSQRSSSTSYCSLCWRLWTQPVPSTTSSFRLARLLCELSSSRSGSITHANCISRQITGVVSGAIAYGAVTLFRVSGCHETVV
jgi:hypothetical protein